jgi:hypothetical protein
MPNEDVVALLGGLGNQLFQVSFARWLEMRTGRPVRYDVAFHRSGEPDVLAVPGIGDDVRGQLLSRTIRWPTPNGRVALLGRAMRRLRGPRRIVADYSGAGPDSPSADAAAWWFGYWQRLEYARELTGRLAASLAEGTDSDSEPVLGVHIRRTDMLTRGTVVPEKWFSESLARLELDLSNAPVRVWSDDPEWCRRELRLGVRFEVAPPAPPLSDLRDLSRCRALLISRSTFSWWAAKVASERGVRVAYPAPWWPATPELDRVTVPGEWMPIAVDPPAVERSASI